MFNSPLKDICIFSAVALIAGIIAVYCMVKYYKFAKGNKETIQKAWKNLKK